MLLALDVDDAMFIISLYCGILVMWFCGILTSLFDEIIMKIKKKMLLTNYGESWLCGGLFYIIMVKRENDMSDGGKIARFFTW